MNKGRILAELEAMAVSRLFGNGPWLADREAIYAITRRFQEMGLEEQIAENATRNTALGSELGLDIMMVFTGVFDEWEMAIILEQYGLLDREAVDDILDGPNLSEHGERILRPIVQKAFFAYHRSSGWVT